MVSNTLGLWCLDNSIPRGHLPSHFPQRLTYTFTVVLPSPFCAFLTSIIMFSISGKKMLPGETRWLAISHYFQRKKYLASYKSRICLLFHRFLSPQWSKPLPSFFSFLNLCPFPSTVASSPGSILSLLKVKNKTAHSALLLYLLPCFSFRFQPTDCFSAFPTNPFNHSWKASPNPGEIWGRLLNLPVASEWLTTHWAPGSHHSPFRLFFDLWLLIRVLSLAGSFLDPPISVGVSQGSSFPDCYFKTTDWHLVTEPSRALSRSPVFSACLFSPNISTNLFPFCSVLMAPKVSGLALISKHVISLPEPLPGTHQPLDMPCSWTHRAIQDLVPDCDSGLISSWQLAKH